MDRTSEASEAMSRNPADATLRKLFGGAMECLLPAAYVDVSDLRQVPDHQEVFVSREDGISIVIEVLSFETDIDVDTDVHGKNNGASARHFFDDLAAANGATSSACDFCGELTDSIMPKLAPYSKSALAGRQTVAKFREDAPLEAVRLYLVNVRLPNVDTDLLITVNVPYADEETAEKSMASAECFCSGAPKPSAGVNEEGPTGIVASADEAKSMEASSLVRHDAGDPRVETENSSKKSVDVSQEEERGATQEAKIGGGGVRDAPEDPPGQTGTVEEGGRQRPSFGKEGDVDVGVAALRTILRSFTILDWSLFG